MTLRDEGRRLPRKVSRALPVFALDERKDAEALRVALCRLAYDGRYVLDWMGFTGEVTQLPVVSGYLAGYARGARMAVGPEAEAANAYFRRVIA